VALIQQELARDPRERDLKDIERKLKALATITRGTLMELDAPPRSARAVGIEDVVEVEAVRQAWETLGTEDIVRQVRAIAHEEVAALD
jgi:RNA polymerase-interacting CarD/CdnL/TRCF family regulator